MTQQKLGFSHLEVGHEFPPATYNLDSVAVSVYFKATGEADTLYQGTGFVPPIAIAAWSLAALQEAIDLPSGTIHLSQEVECLGIAQQGDLITCHAKISRKQERGKLRLMNIDFHVVDQNQRPVLAGKSSFNLP